MSEGIKQLPDIPGPSPDDLHKVETDVFVISDSEDIFDAESKYGHLTGATTDPVKDYLKQIGKVPLLNAEMEVELSKRIEAGLYAASLLLRSPEQSESSDKLFTLPSDGMKLTDEELEWLADDGIKAKNHLIEANLRLVVSIAKRYAGRGMQFLDIIQEGNKGLIRGVEKFDYTQGYKFSTYATWWIRQQITRGLADQARTIRVPIHMTELLHKRDRIEREMAQDLGREPTAEELAKELDITVDKLKEIQEYGKDPISLHTPLGEGDGAEFGDMIEDTTMISPQAAADFSGMRDAIRGTLDQFSEREAGVITMRFGLDDGDPKTLDEVGEKYGVTRERIRQIQAEVIKKLRKSEYSGRLQGLLES